MGRIGEWRRRRVALAEDARVLALAIVLHGTTSTVMAQSTAYHFFDEEVPVDIDLSRVAFVAPDPTRVVVATVDAVAVQWGESRVSFTTIEGATSKQDVIDRINDLIPQTIDAVVSPVLINPTLADGENLSMVIGDELFVGFRADVPAQRRAQLLDAHALQLVEASLAGLTDVVRVRSASRNGFEILDAANRLAVLPETMFAEPAFVFGGKHSTFCGTPNDPMYPDSYAPVKVGAEPVWCDHTTGEGSIITVVIDSGVELLHPDLNMAVDGSGVPLSIDTTFEGGDGGPSTYCDRHGTIVAGAVASRLDNGLGTAGVAPDTTLASVCAQVAFVPCSGFWVGEALWTAKAIEWAATINARVTVNSNNYSIRSSLISATYAQTRAQGMIHFASTGNNASQSIGFPANVAEVNAITAIDEACDLAGWATYHPGPDYAAPGVDIWTTDLLGPDGFSPTDYALMSGTSLAAPVAAGVSALVLSFDPTLSTPQLEAAMRLGAVSLNIPGGASVVGNGLPHAANTIALLAQCQTSSTTLSVNDDCNGDGINDDCQIINDPSLDADADGVLDECDPACPCECDQGPGRTILDLFCYLIRWFGQVVEPSPSGLTGDYDGNGTIDIIDLLSYLDCWFTDSPAGCN